MALKILLADDSMTAQNMGKKILLDAGYEVVAVSNGAAAIKRIAADRPDIIIVDEYMPGYTGSEVCERVKNSPDTSRTPVLLTVGKMEPFSPDKANKVRADGVLIKPFEATDLIAVIQSIANKMSGGSSDVGSSRQEAPARPAPPVPSQEHGPHVPAAGHNYPDTVPISPPRDAQPNPVYEETLRLTPEQIRAFQDKTYKDWVASSETEKNAPVSEAAPDMPLAAPVVAEAHETSVQEVTPSVPEPIVPSVIEEPAMPIMPDLDLTEAPFSRTKTGSIGQDFFTVAPVAPADSDQHGSVEAPAMFAVESAVDEISEPVFSVQTPEPEVIEVATTAPVVTEGASLELETSAPQTPGPSFVTALDGLETTIAAPEDLVVSEVAPELEINSPIHLQDHVDVAPDAALVSDEDDMSQFVTKFGQDGAEEVHIGLASDLPPEQMAALTTPVEQEIKQEVPELESPEVVFPPMVELEASAPVLPEAVLLSAEPEAAVESPVVATPANVLSEVGPMEADAALSGTGPNVAYVPGIEDTQPLPAFVVPPVEHEVAISEPEPILAAEVELVAEPEPIVAAVENEPASESEAVAAIAEEKVVETETGPSLEIVEAASAAAAGGAVLGASHFFSAAPVPEPAIAEIASAIEEPVAEAQVEPAVSEEPESPFYEPVGDAALAEELAAALDEQQATDNITSAADAAIAGAVEPTVAAVMESSGPEAHMIADAKLSDAVSRALEKLRPQLIQEIMKELFK